MPDVISRIAPTPSGRLHIGNAVNFLLTWLTVRLHGGTLLLRIDDLDQARCRPEYVDDIFSSLAWLGIEPDAGPSGTAEFYAHYSQTLRYDAYRDALELMRERGAHLFACRCSRKTLAGAARYPGTCRDRGLTLRPMQTALRIAIPDKSVITLEEKRIAPARTVGDFILWRKDDIPAYQLVSTIEDRDAGVNVVVRGRDLYESSVAQLYLAPFLDAATFSKARFLHHDLILRPDGSKFSKSDRDVSLADLRNSMTETHALHLVFESVQRLLGLPIVAMERPETLLQQCMAYAADNKNPLLQALKGTGTP